jgi:hypothetical protein
LAKARRVWLTNSRPDRPARRHVSSTDMNTSWARAPTQVRFPPQTFRCTTAGRIACSPSSVGRLDLGVAQEREPLIQVFLQMRRQRLVGRYLPRRPGQVPQSLVALRARWPQLLGRHLALWVPVAEVDRLGEQRDQLPRVIRFPGISCALARSVIAHLASCIQPARAQNSWKA